MQSGFEFVNKNSQTVLSLSKLADIPISYHREIPKNVTVKEVCIKKERTGEWYASFAVEDKKEPANPANSDRHVGTDIGILKHVHDTDGRAIGSLDLKVHFLYAVLASLSAFPFLALGI
ncbi:transposase [Haloquadratum walsbyi]|uniref:Putative transposase n=1 Tax=Haloquadratum walsbyi J07HQW2 TaxID=1238425 RepID=U1MVK7_9EURY|nr:transposase [Haloquadratum walsbyi]ERG94424.1 MAG: putative transposase [Haloquadratum walsbyi J07HQW2]